MGPVDETQQMFTLDCYFRQFWSDPRLVFNSTGVEELTMNWQFLSKIWRPDTYFLNSKDSYLHKIMVPNRFIEIMMVMMTPNYSRPYCQNNNVHMNDDDRAQHNDGGGYDDKSDCSRFMRMMVV